MSMKLIVGNLSPEATEHRLREMFAVHGRVTEVDVIVDRLTGHPRGLAFVSMESNSAAVAAIQAMNGRFVGGRALMVTEARAS